MQAVLNHIRGGGHLTMEEMVDVIDAIMQGQWAEDQIGELLLSLRAKGETVDEIAGAAAALRRHMTPIRSDRQVLIDTCGTGGDASGTFNISTAAALVTAAAGVAVAKHGNRSVTSKSGSADVLAALGVRVDADVTVVEACLDQAGICFCFAVHLHPSMRHVAGVRKRLGVPTIFNLLGPLCNPAGAPYQLLGVGRADLRPKLAAALERLGTRRSVVVCGADGLDEVTLAGETLVTEVSAEGSRDFRWHPREFGLEVNDLETLRVDGPDASANVIRGVLSGESGPATEIVILNAAAALWTAGQSDSLRQCATTARAAISSGAASEKLQQWIALSHG